jgi:hypothetical protein
MSESPLKDFDLAWAYMERDDRSLFRLGEYNAVSGLMA